MSDHIPLSVPCVRGNEWKYVKECLNTEWVSSAGSYVDAFEKGICDYTGAPHAVACVNGTSALHVSLLIAGVRSGDLVIVPTLTFIAPVNAIRYLGAEPVFMDCDEYYNLDVEKTIEFISQETIFQQGKTIDRTTGGRIAAILPVHVFGNAVRLEELAAVCRERNIPIVEDATESLGTAYTQGRLTGKHTGTVGDLGCFSFNGNKIITTGGGGMIVTSRSDYAERAKYLTTQAKDDEVRYIHNEIGYNYRLTNIQAAIGVAQLEKLDEYIEKKRFNYNAYKTNLSDIEGLRIADVPQYSANNCWMVALQVEKNKYGKDRDQLMGHLAQQRIQTRPVWYLNHLQKPYLGCRSYRIERALSMWENTLNLPCSVNLDGDSIHRVVQSLRNDR